jgi:hypothetical protein
MRTRDGETTNIPLFLIPGKFDPPPSTLPPCHHERSE